MVETNDGDPGQDRVETEQVISPEVAATARSILGTVVSQGTGTNAATGATVEWGKTGTTENNGDAWFVGATEDITVAVWVGHANSVKPMLTEFGGAPVDGGTIPALIFHDVVLAYEQLSSDQAADEEIDHRRRHRHPVRRQRPRPRPSEPAPSETAGRHPAAAAAPSHRRRPAAAPRAAPAAASRRASGRAQLAQRPREVLAAGGAEAPGKLGGAADADSGAGRDRDLAPAVGRGPAARRGAR